VDVAGSPQPGTGDRQTWHWIDPDRPDPRDLAAAVGVLEAARVADRPYLLEQNRSNVLAEARFAWDGETPRYAVVRARAGTAVGVVAVETPEQDNRHLVYATVTVDPAHRGRGIGGAMLDAVVATARATGRRVLMTDATAGAEPAGHLLRSRGFGVAGVDAVRRLDLTGGDHAAWRADHEQAARAAAAYDLLRLDGPVPDDLLDAFVVMTSAINDAPFDDLDVEDELFTAERLRAFERAQAGRDRRTYRLVARERVTGELAGVTSLAVEAERPWHAEQYDTSVVRTHRGHRLGLLLKTGMLLWLATAEPQLRRIDTGNAVSNDRMVAVNERLGFRVVELQEIWQRPLRLPAGRPPVPTPGLPVPPLPAPPGAGR
jgi:RimJ/RimL family protein N-acetyltransferase